MVFLCILVVEIIFSTVGLKQCKYNFFICTAVIDFQNLWIRSCTCYMDRLNHILFRSYKICCHLIFVEVCNCAKKNGCNSSGKTESKDHSYFTKTLFCSMAVNYPPTKHSLLSLSPSIISFLLKSFNIALYLFQIFATASTSPLHGISLR